MTYVICRLSKIASLMVHSLALFLDREIGYSEKRMTSQLPCMGADFNSMSTRPPTYPHNDWFLSQRPHIQVDIICFVKM